MTDENHLHAPAQCAVEWSDEDYKRARDCMRSILQDDYRHGRNPLLDLNFDNAFQHAVGILSLTARAIAAQPSAVPVETDAEADARRLHREKMEMYERAITAEAKLAEITADIEKLKDPVAVHINMLRGGIAKPSWKNIQHLYPEHFQCSAETSGQEG